MAPASLNMAQDGAPESPTCLQDVFKAVKYASALSIFRSMSTNIVFPAVFVWFVAPKMSQDGLLESLRWPNRVPRWSQEGQVGAKMSPTWPQDRQRCANIGQHRRLCAETSIFLRFFMILGVQSGESAEGASPLPGACKIAFSGLEDEKVKCF